MPDSAQAISAPRPVRSPYDDRIRFHEADQILEVNLADLTLADTPQVNALYDRVEERIAETGEPLWFFLIDYANTRVDPSAWWAWSLRGKALNLAHSMATVRFDPSPETRAQIERDAGTEAFDPNLFADRAAAIARLRETPSRRVEKIVHVPTLDREDYRRRVTLDPATGIAEFDLSGVVFNHALDVNLCYDVLEEVLGATDRKWYFLVNYEGCRILSNAWVEYAARGKRFNQAFSLGSVRYAPGSETETDIRLRAESGGFRPNIRNTREEALARIDELKRGEA